MPGVPPIDPTEPPSRTARAMKAISNTRFGRWVGINASERIDPALMRLSGGRIATTFFFPLVRLAVRGRKSGIERIVPLVYFTEGEEVILTASSFGRPGYPAWYLNVKANPEVELIVGAERLPYLARETGGEERERLLGLAKQLYAGYGTYEELTAGVRKIPVLALRPRDGREEGSGDG